MATKGCITRLQKEYKALQREPVPHLTAHPTANLLEWHFVLEGAAGTDYEGGVYHGRLVFPPNYPFKPPSILMITPNGRFAVNTKLCLSITDYHPESWNPMWSVGTILTGLLSFMYDSQPTTGSITTVKAEKQRMARESLAFNCKNPTFRKTFPEWVEEHSRRMAAAAARAPAASQQQQQQQAQPQNGAGQQRDAAQQQHELRPARAGGGGGGLGAAGGAPRQQHAGDRGAAAGVPPGGTPGNSALFTAAVVVLVLAIAVFPLCSSDMRASLALLKGRLFSPDAL